MHAVVEGVSRAVNIPCVYHLFCCADTKHLKTSTIFFCVEPVNTPQNNPPSHCSCACYPSSSPRETTAVKPGTLHTVQRNSLHHTTAIELFLFPARACPRSLRFSLLQVIRGAKRSRKGSPRSKSSVARQENRGCCQMYRRSSGDGQRTCGARGGNVQGGSRLALEGPTQKMRPILRRYLCFHGIFFFS